jgi:hypothetical protein
MQIVDLVLFSLSSMYSLWLLRFLKRSHPAEIQSAYSTPSLVVRPRSARHRSSRSMPPGV